MSASNTYENLILDHLFGGPDLVREATLYIALFTANPGEAGGGTEVNGNNYARVAVTNDDTEWPAAANGQKKNANVIQFPDATPNGWGTITGFGIFDAAANGTLLFYGSLVQNRTVEAGDSFRFPPNELIITAD